MNTKAQLKNSIASIVLMLGSFLLPGLAFAEPLAIGPDFTVRVNVGETHTATSPRTDMWPKFQENPPLLLGTCSNRCTYSGLAVSGDNIVSLDTGITGFGDGWFHPLDLDGTSPYSTAGKQTFEVRATLIADGTPCLPNFVTGIVIVNGAPVITSRRWCWNGTNQC